MDPNSIPTTSGPASSAAAAVAVMPFEEIVANHMPPPSLNPLGIGAAPPLLPIAGAAPMMMNINGVMVPIAPPPVAPTVAAAAPILMNGLVGGPSMLPAPGGVGGGGSFTAALSAAAATAAAVAVANATAGGGLQPSSLLQQQQPSMLVQVGVSLQPPSSSSTNAGADNKKPEDFFTTVKTNEPSFTTEKYTNPLIPAYVPPEFFVMDHGLFLKAFLSRCTVHDCARMIQDGAEESYYLNVNLEKRFDAKGNRVDVAAEMLTKKNQEALGYLKRLISQFRNETTRDGEVCLKYVFKPHEIPLIGSLFGARGETQKWLVKESGVLRIEFAGRGLTKRQKKHNAIKGMEKNDALEHEDPHAFIVGYDKASVGEAARLIEWLLSDAPDAVEKRDENHRRLKEKDGTYDPTTYKPLSVRMKEQQYYDQQQTTSAAVGSKRQREDGEAHDDDDDDYDEYDAYNGSGGGAQYHQQQAPSGGGGDEGGIDDLLDDMI